MALTKVSYSMISGAVANVLDFGADPTGSQDSTAAVWAAIQSLRTNPTQILDTIGGGIITAYSSGTVYFPSGMYKVSPDNLLIYQDLGLQFKGEGSRRTNNAVLAPTTLLISGTSSGYGIRVYRNGARGFTLEDLDLCYADAAFTGSVLDILDCPGLTANRVYFGTDGITAPTRLQTAAACVRATYDEFTTFNNCVFNGAVDGIWFDDARTELGNTFGGSITAFNNCVWYDFTGDMIRHDGLRTRSNVTISGCAFNPISVDCVRCVDLNNVEGLTCISSAFSPSVANKPTIEWIRLINCTSGNISSCTFDDFAKAGTLSGVLNVSGNRIYCTDGFTVTGGVVSGKSNEFSQATTGWTISPTTTVSATLGPDLFKAPVSYSYDIPADSALLSGHISYCADTDASINKFRNTSSRITIDNADAKQFSVASTPYTLLLTDTGRTINATGGTNQTFNLPVPVPGVTFRIAKISGVDLAVVCSAGKVFYGKNLTTYTTATVTGTAQGVLTLAAFGTAGWLVMSETGSWTFT